MPQICYVRKRFSLSHQVIIDRTNSIISEYSDQGYSLTLRQIYYQHVSKGWIENSQKSYKRLGDILSDARRAGLIDWNAIEDRTRNLQSFPFWSSPAEIVSSCASQFSVDMWKNQSYRCECFVEKDALIGILEVACSSRQVPYFSCRGYTSDSEIWVASQRMKSYENNGQIPVILHLGDHDPSGKDMTRDIVDRINLFGQLDNPIDVRRLALNWDQIQEYNPPPNPAKSTDTRYAAYAAEFGEESWELDALNPKTITGLIQSEIDTLIDTDLWKESGKERDQGRRDLRTLSHNWDQAIKSLRNKKGR